VAHCGSLVYSGLHETLLVAVLDRVRDQAANEAERHEIIDVYVAQITEIIEDTPTTTEQAFGIIDMIAADLKSDWEEMRASEPISRAAARKA
jgi:hypothetical protein